MNIKIYKQNIIQIYYYNQCELKDFFLGIVYFLVFKSAFFLITLRLSGIRWSSKLLYLGWITVIITMQSWQPLHSGGSFIYS